MILFPERRKDICIHVCVYTMFWLLCAACGISVPQSGIKPTSAVEGRFLTTGPPGKSPNHFCYHVLKVAALGFAAHAGDVRPSALFHGVVCHLEADSSQIVILTCPLPHTSDYISSCQLHLPAYS